MNCDYQPKTQEGENSEKSTFHTEKKSYGQHGQNRYTRSYGSNDDQRMTSNNYNHPHRSKEGSYHNRKSGPPDRRQNNYPNHDFNHREGRPPRGFQHNQGQNKFHNAVDSTPEFMNSYDHPHSHHPPPRAGGNYRSINSSNAYKPPYTRRCAPSSSNIGSTNNNPINANSHYNNVEALKGGGTNFSHHNDKNNINISWSKNMTSGINKDSGYGVTDQVISKTTGDISSTLHLPQSKQSVDAADGITENHMTISTNDHTSYHVNHIETNDSNNVSDNQIGSLMSQVTIEPSNLLSPQKSPSSGQSSDQIVQDDTPASDLTSSLPSEDTSPHIASNSGNSISPDNSPSEILEMSSAELTQITPTPSTSVADSGTVVNPTASTSGDASSAAPTTTWKPRKATYSRGEGAIERQAKSLLNKLTIERFPTIIEKLAQLVENVKDQQEMQSFVNLIVSKAALERDWSEMYADMCLVLFWRSPCFENPKSNSFRLALVTKIENEFLSLPESLELSEKEKEGLDQSSIDLEITKLKNHIYGVFTLIGELYQRKLLAYQVLNHVVLELVINNERPHEHFIECFVQLIWTTGYFIEQNPAGKSVLDLWFGRLTELKNKNIYSKRLICIIQNTLDLRKSNWLRKIHKFTASGLDEIRDQFDNEIAVGGQNFAAYYGKVVTVGKPINASMNNQYGTYMEEQRAKYLSKRSSH